MTFPPPAGHRRLIRGAIMYRGFGTLHWLPCSWRHMHTDRRHLGPIFVPPMRPWSLFGIFWQILTFLANFTFFGLSLAFLAFFWLI
jgi:hypothetical protein